MSLSPTSSALKCYLAATLLGLLPASVALAHAPATVVIEIGAIKAGDSLTACQGIRLQGGAVFISKQLSDQVRGKAAANKYIHIEAGLTQSEDINRIMLLRGKGSCHIFLATKQLPDPETMSAELPAHKFKWSIDPANPVLHMHTKSGKLNLAGGKGGELKTGRNDIRVFNYGRLALWEGSAELETDRLHIYGGYRGHFDGPGAVSRLFMKIPEAGTVGITLHPASLRKNIEMEFSRPGRVFSWHTGSRKDFDGPSKAILSLQYNGFGPADYKLTPSFARRAGQADLKCRLLVGKQEKGVYPVELKLSNEGSMPAEIVRIDEQTLTWYINMKKQEQGIIWERPPEKAVLRAGKSISIHTAFEHDPIRDQVYAEIWIPKQGWSNDNRIICLIPGENIYADPLLKVKMFYIKPRRLRDLFDDHLNKQDVPLRQADTLYEQMFLAAGKVEKDLFELMQRQSKLRALALPLIEHPELMKSDADFLRQTHLFKELKAASRKVNRAWKDYQKRVTKSVKEAGYDKEHVAFARKAIGDALREIKSRLHNKQMYQDEGLAVVLNARAELLKDQRNSWNLIDGKIVSENQQFKKRYEFMNHDIRKFRGEY